MLNPFLKVEWLKEGRNVRLPMIIIFYNAILAFITILFMFFNAESLQEGYSYNTSSYLYQFLIISTFQIGMIFVLMPFSVWGFYATDREKHMLEEFAMIPGSSKQFVIARVSVIIAIYMMLFVSSLPIISLSCIYSGLPWRKILRLGIMMLICTFWSAFNFCFPFSYCNERNLGICTEYSNRSNVCFRNSFSNGNNTVIFDFSNRSRKSCTDRYQFMYAF